MSNKKYLRTPIIYPRTQGGTFYTFGSALEDIGLNINELNHRVRMSHYVLLDIPDFSAEDVCANGNYTDGDKIFADGFQNYVLNMETVLRNQPSYSYDDASSVSERVFWKWMGKHMMQFEAIENTGYYKDVKEVVKGFGAISAGAQRTDEYNIYNETFVQIPSSYGQMDVLFKPKDDNNYFVSSFISMNDPDSAAYTNNKIENCINPTETTTEVGLSNTASYDTGVHGYTIGANENLCVELDINKLRLYYNDAALTYDDLAIDEKYRTLLNEKTPADYEFNAILIYYSIYDTNGNTLATNAYGLLLLDKAISSGSVYTIPAYSKKESSAGSDGTSFSFRLNIKTASVYNGNAVIEDNSSPAYQYATDFNDTIRNLANAVEILKSNANVIKVLASNNATIKSLCSSIISKVDSLDKDIANIKNNKTKDILANNISANTISTDKILADTSIVHIDETSKAETEVGSFNEDEFTYTKINTEELTANSAKISTAHTNVIVSDTDAPVVVKSNSANYIKFENTGAYSEDSYFAKTNSTGNAVSISEADLKSILNNIQIKDTGDGYRLSVSQSTNANNSVVSAAMQKLADSSYNDILSILAILIEYVKTL